MGQDGAADAAEKHARVRALLRQRIGKDCFAPFPGIDTQKGYDFPLFAAETLRALERPELRWVRPAQTLENVLRRRGPTHGHPASQGDRCK